MMLAGMTPEDFIVGSPSQQINRWTKLPMFPPKGETGHQKAAEKRNEESGRSSSSYSDACPAGDFLSRSDVYGNISNRFKNADVESMRRAGKWAGTVSDIEDLNDILDR